MKTCLTKDSVGAPFPIWLILLLLSAAAYGQLPGGMMDTNTQLNGFNSIVGTVFEPSGHPIHTRIRIELSSLAGRDIIATTDDDGRFVFTGVRPGNYDIVIDREAGYAPISQRIDVLPSDAPVMYTVMLRLRSDAKKPDKPTVVDVADGRVPKQASELYKKAAELESAGNEKEAIEQLKRAVAEYPAYFSALSQIGLLYLRSNELEKADEALKAALAIKPDAYAPLINRGIVLFRLERLDEAESTFRCALKTKADSASAYYYLGRTVDRLGQTDKAIAAYRESIKLGPEEFKEAHRMLAIIYLARKSCTEVVEELETYLRLVPTATDAADLRKVIEQCKRSMPAAAEPKPALDN